MPEGEHKGNERDQTMKQLVAAVFTLSAIVAGIVLATSLSSSAQEDGGTGDTTTTTVADEPGYSGRFGFRFGGEFPPEIDELLACLSDQGLDVPEDPDGSFMFDLRRGDIDGLAAALEACGLPSLGDRFLDRLPFGGDLPEGFPFGDELPEGFPFGDEFPEGPSFGDEFPEGFPFGGKGFGFHFRDPGLDLDELAGCLAELESFDSVDQVRGKLDECLPKPAEWDELDPDDFDGFHFRRHHGFPFGGPFGFGFEFDAPDPDDTSA